MIRVRFYLDISGGKSDTPTLAAAGYLATEDAWGRFEKAWGRILRDAAVPAFHATDFYGGHADFRHIPKGSPEQVAFERRFLGAINKHTKVGYGFGFDVRTYRRVMGEALSKSRRLEGMDPRVYAYAYCLNRAAQKALPRGTVTAAFFEQEHGIGGVLSYLAWLKKKQREGWTEAYSGFGVLTKRERALQAADMLAYHAGIRIRDVGRDSNAAIRPAMASLLSRRSVAIDASTEEDFRTSAAAVERFLIENPEYAAKPKPAPSS